LPEREKKRILAEELGHYYTGTGDILNQSASSNRKQEAHGRIFAYNKLIGLMGIVGAYKNYCQNLFEAADHLYVTEKFLREALQYYKNKYGNHVTVDNYTIYFEPYFGVFEFK